MTQRYKLIASPVSYYSGKARAYLRFKGVPFDELMSTAEMFKTEILPRVGRPVIPVLITPEDQTVQDTTLIMDLIESRFPRPSITPAGPRQRVASLLLELYGDEWLLIPAMHYRWRYNEDFVLEEFGKSRSPDLAPAEQRALGREVAGRFKGFVPYLGITPDTEAGVEASYEAFLDAMNIHFAAYPYTLGDRPSAGDFGLIGPLYAHLYRDPKSGEMMKARAPRVADWVERMIEPPEAAGDFLPDDEVPETLSPVLTAMFREQAPVLVDTVQKLSAWLEANPGEEIPRAIGGHGFTIGGAAGQRMIFPYPQWMLQRVIDLYRNLAPAERDAVNAWAGPLGGLELLNLEIPNRVDLVNHKLVSITGDSI